MDENLRTGMVVAAKLAAGVTLATVGLIAGISINYYRRKLESTKCRLLASQLENCAHKLRIKTLQKENEELESKLQTKKGS